MKNYIFLLVLVMFFYESCGDDRGTEVAQARTMDIEVISDVSELPECDISKENVLIWVKNELIPRMCFEGLWYVIAERNATTCITLPLDDKSGVKILCGDDSVGVVVLNGKDGKQGEKGDKGDKGGAGVNGKDGSDGKDGSSCTVVALSGDSGFKILCGGDSVGVVLNGKDGKQGEKGDSGISDTTAKTLLVQTQENPLVEQYLLNVDYSSDTSYSISYIDEYRKVETVYDKSRPFPVYINWNVDTSASNQIIEICDNAFFNNAWLYSIEKNVSSLDVYNLIPGIRYYYRVKSLIKDKYKITASGEFTVRGNCRMLFIDGKKVGNFRDLGGWIGLNGKHVKYGRLIRGSEIYRENIIQVSESGIDMLVNKLNISVELDFGDVHTESPLENYGVEFIHGPSILGIIGYNDPEKASLASIKGRLKYFNCLDTILSKLIDGKNIYFHCNAGADRTGTLAFIIEALLGVSESDLSKDYELTAFYDARYRSVNVSDPYGWPSMIAWIKANYAGSTLNEKVYDMCTRTPENGGIGFSANKIDRLREIMLE